MFELIPGSAHDMSYGTDGPHKERCIGHMRFDFGDGNEFWNTWWPGSADDEHNTADFKEELAHLITYLRSSILESAKMAYRQAMALRLPYLDTEQRYFGFHVRTKKHQYCIRLDPSRGNYSYVYCYFHDVGDERKNP